MVYNALLQIFNKIYNVEHINFVYNFIRQNLCILSEGKNKQLLQKLLKQQEYLYCKPFAFVLTKNNLSVTKPRHIDLSKGVCETALHQETSLISFHSFHLTDEKTRCAKALCLIGLFYCSFSEALQDNLPRCHPLYLTLSYAAASLKILFMKV